MRVWPGLIGLIVLLVGSFPVQSSDLVHFRAAGLERFDEAPDLPNLSLPDPDGTPVALRSLRGKVVLLNFWTTW